MTNEKLIDIAKAARENACVDISGFAVGAALLTDDGKVFKGCNIEDPSGIGITNICAERCAIVKALSEGSRGFVKIAVVGGMRSESGSADDRGASDLSDNLIFCPPCGACRQYLNSWSPEIDVIMQEEDGNIKQLSLKELLPYSFNETF